jgi:hypothetical protein
MVKITLPSGETVSFSETWPQRRIEWMLAFALLGTGFIYGFSPSMDDVPQYEAQLRLLPPFVWMLIFCTIGGVRVLFLFVNGNYRRSPHWRSAGAALGCLGWATQSISVFASGLFIPVTFLWPLFFAFDLHVALTAASEAARNDFKASPPSTLQPEAADAAGIEATENAGGIA